MLDKEWGFITLLCITLFVILLLSSCKAPKTPSEPDSLQISLYNSMTKFHHPKFFYPTTTLKTPFSSLDDVNTYVNSFPYVTDPMDIWQKPDDFFKNGGDCEDYALAKYALIKKWHLGNPSLAIVEDMNQKLPHAVLIVNKEYVLDSETNTILTISQTLNKFYYYGVIVE